MTAHDNHGGTAAGTVGGTLLTIVANIHSEDIVKTAVLALIGATVSFGASMFMKWISKGIRRRQ